MPFKKRRVLGKGSGVSVKKVDKKQDRRLKKLESVVGNPELKNFAATDPDMATANGGSVQHSNAMVITPISDPTAGQGGSSRIGDKILVKGLDIKLSAWFKGPQYAQFVRFVCFIDRGYANGADPTGNDILLTYNTTVGSLYNMMSPLHPDRFGTKYDTRKSNMQKNYKLIFDVTLTPPSLVGTEAAGLAPAVHVHKSIRKRLNNMVYFSGTDELAGKMYIAVFPGNHTTNTSNPYYNWYSDIFYVDM